MGEGQEKYRDARGWGGREGLVCIITWTLCLCFAAVMIATAVACVSWAGGCSAGRGSLSCYVLSSLLCREELSFVH